MEELILKLLAEFKVVGGEVYFHRNHSKDILFPHIVFDLTGEPLEHNVEGFYLDVDIYDSSTSYSALLGVEDGLKAHLKDNQIMVPELYIRFEYLGSNTINTIDRLIKRRNLQFYCKVDWRKL